MPSNISLQSRIDYVTTSVRGVNLSDVLGIQNEPALTLCNNTYQEVLQRPLTWRFNKANAANSGLGILEFTSYQFQQDYPCTNATATVTNTAAVHIQTVANSGLVVSSNVATVTTMWPHGFVTGNNVTMLNVGSYGVGGIFATDPALNATFTIASVPTATSFTFAVTHANGTFGAPGVSDVGWIERCVLEDYANTATIKPRHSIEVTMNLELESIIQPPFKISYQYTTVDSGGAANQILPATIAIFRLWPVPSQQVWGAMVDYQMKPTIFTDLSQNWGVWPDELMFVIDQGLKAYALDFVQAASAMTEYQLFQTKLDQVREIRDQERPSQTMFPDRPILFGG